MKGTLLTAGLLYAAATVMTGAAMAAGIDGTGTVGTCPVTGQIKIKPALKTGGTDPGALKVKGKGTCSGGTMDGATIASMKVKGTGTTTSTDCVNLVGVQPADIEATVKWKVSPGSDKLNPSTIKFTSQTGGVTMDGHGSFDVTGTVTAGSFTGNPVTAHIETDLPVADILTACGAKGVKKIVFTNPNSNVSF